MSYEHPPTDPTSPPDGAPTVGDIDPSALTAPRVPEWLSRTGAHIGRIASAVVIGYGMHRGFHSELPLVGNASEHLGNVAEVAEVAVISGTLAVSSLRSYVSGLRRYKASRELDRVEEAIPTRELLVDDVRRSVETVIDGKARITGGTGVVLPKSHHRTARKLNNARDKASRVLNEGLGDRRHLGKPVVRHIKIEDKHPFTKKVLTTRWIQVTDSDIGTADAYTDSDIGTADAYSARVDSIPRTKKERDMYARAAHEHKHEEHKARDIWEIGVHDTQTKAERSLFMLEEKREKLNRRVAKRGGYVGPLEDQPTKPGRTYRAAKNGARVAGRVSMRAAKRAKKLWDYR